MAREQRKRAAESRRRRKKKAGSKSSAVQRALVRFRLWRLQTSKVYKKRWAKALTESKVLAFLYKRRNWLLALLFLAGVGLFSFFLLRESAPQNIGQGPIDFGERVALEINGKAIPYKVYVDTLVMAHGPEVLQKLTEQEVVRQEAERLKLEITPAEVSDIALKADKDPTRRRLHDAQLRTSLLLRKIILKQTSEERLQEVYQSFKGDLTLYSLQALRFKDRPAAGRFLEAVRKGTPSDIAASKFAENKGQVMAFGNMTVAQIHEQLGPGVAKEISEAQEGGLTSPVSARGSVFLFRVAKILTSYEDVKPAAVDLVVEAETTQTMYDLLSKAQIRSQFLEKNLLKEDPQPSSTPVSTPSTSPTSR